MGAKLRWASGHRLRMPVAHLCSIQPYDLGGKFGKAGDHQEHRNLYRCDGLVGLCGLFLKVKQGGLRRANRPNIAHRRCNPSIGQCLSTLADVPLFLYTRVLVECHTLTNPQRGWRSLTPGHSEKRNLDSQSGWWAAPIDELKLNPRTPNLGDLPCPAQHRNLKSPPLI